MSQSVLCPVLIGRAGELALLGERLRQATKGTGAQDLARRGSSAPRACWSYGYLGVGLAYLGRLTEGLEYLDQSFHEALPKGLFLIAADALYRAFSGA